MREEKDAGQIRLHHRVPLRPGQLFEARADAIAGVVHEEVDPPELLERPRDEVVDLPRISDIARDGERPSSFRAHRLGDRLERGEPAAARDDVSADLRHLDGDRAADALAGARDDGHAVAKRVGRKAHRTY